MHKRHAPTGSAPAWSTPGLLDGARLLEAVGGGAAGDLPGGRRRGGRGRLPLGELGVEVAGGLGGEVGRLTVRLEALLLAHVLLDERSRRGRQPFLLDGRGRRLLHLLVEGHLLKLAHDGLGDVVLDDLGVLARVEGRGLRLVVLLLLGLLLGVEGRVGVLRLLRLPERLDELAVDVRAQDLAEALVARVQVVQVAVDAESLLDDLGRGA